MRFALVILSYLHTKDYIKSVKNPFLNLDLNNLYHPMAFVILSYIVKKLLFFLSFLFLFSNEIVKGL